MKGKHKHKWDYLRDILLERVVYDDHAHRAWYPDSNMTHGLVYTCKQVCVGVCVRAGVRVGGWVGVCMRAFLRACVYVCFMGRRGDTNACFFGLKVFLRRYHERWVILHRTATLHMLSTNH